MRDIAPSVPTTLATPQTGWVKVYKNNYFSKIQTSVQSNHSNTVSGNASYPLQLPVQCKTNPMGKHNLFIVADSHMKSKSIVSSFMVVQMISHRTNKLHTFWSHDLAKKITSNFVKSLVLQKLQFPQFCLLKT